MRAILLGGAGFLGLHLARRLTADGHAVTVVDDFSRGAKDDDLTTSGAEVIDVDLTDPAGYARLPRDVDQVYLLAAVVGVRNVERDPLRVLRVNTLLVMNALEWMPASARLFFASTSETYADGVRLGVVPVPTPEGVPLVVNDVSAPRSSYAISKLWSEAAVVHAAAARGFSWVIGRLHNIYGPRMGTAHVIPELTIRALRGEDPFRVYGMEQRRSFCFVEDAVSMIVDLMAVAEPGIVHIGDRGAHVSIGSLAAEILDMVSHRPTIVPLPAPAGSVPDRAPDLTKLRELTGYDPRTPLRDGLRQTIAWYAQSGLRTTHLNEQP